MGQRPGSRGMDLVEISESLHSELSSARDRCPGRITPTYRCEPYEEADMMARHLPKEAAAFPRCSCGRLPSAESLAEFSGWKQVDVPRWIRHGTVRFPSFLCIFRAAYTETR